MALPLSILYNLNLDTKKRVGLAALFSAGGLIIAFAVIRLIKTAPAYGHVDAKWLCIMSITECAVAVSVSCTPVFRGFFVKRGQNSHHSQSNTGNTSSGRDSRMMRKSQVIAASWEMNAMSEEPVAQRMSTESDEDRITPEPRSLQNEGYAHHKSFWDDNV